MPHEEVRDYFYQRQNYLHDLDTAAEELTARMRFHRGDVGGRDRQPHRRPCTTSRSSSASTSARTSCTATTPETRVLEIAPHLSGGQQVFKFATELAYLECGDLIDKLVDEGSFTSDASRALATLGPGQLLRRRDCSCRTASSTRSPRTSATTSNGSPPSTRMSYETICHRLSTLQRPKLRGVPFSFVRVDRAGNMSKRQSATGFHFSSSGGTCPLWNVYETFAYPGKIMTQIAQMPDGRSYLWVARTVERRAARYGQPGKTFAIGLGCELRHARRLVYADGLDLDDERPRTPIGAGCRVCERINCPQRAFPPLGKEHRHQRAPQLGLAVPGPLTAASPRASAARKDDVTHSSPASHNCDRADILGRNNALLVFGLADTELYTPPDTPVLSGPTFEGRAPSCQLPGPSSPHAPSRRPPRWSQSVSC